jgi:Ser/Thr protein kinase RdoA (MazF antagonist)
MSGTGLAHGLQGTLVAPDWQPLTLDEVRVVLSRLSVPQRAVKILSASPRPFSAASLVETESGRIFIKRHDRRVRHCEGLLEEHRFAQFLRDRGSPVPRVLAGADGETSFEIGEACYEVHEAAAGIDLYGDALSWTPFRNCGHARSAGKALAELHRNTEGFQEPARAVRPLVASFTIFASDDPGAAMRGYLSNRASLAHDEEVRACAEEALELLAPFHAQLSPLLPALQPLWTHNDLHASNMFWSTDGNDAQVTAVIDFGLADRTNAVYDLAHAIERNVVEWLMLVERPEDPNYVKIHLDHLQALLEGYEAVRAMSEDEAHALAPMTALCHAEFALSEADYFLGILNSPERARMAHEGWLVGHARWFHSAAGERLMSFLRGWARERKMARS